MPRDRQPMLKIAQIAPLAEAVPPRLYGGTERVVAHLADSLVELGHDVTLFASGDARTAARLVSVREQAIRLDPRPLKSDVAAHLTMLHQVRERADEFDVLHFHVDLVHFPLFERFADRTVTTLHGRLDIADLAGRIQAVAKVPAGFDFREPAPSVAECELARHRASRNPATAIRLLLRRIAATSLSWGVFRRKSDRSRDRDRPAHVDARQTRCKGRRRGRRLFSRESNRGSMIRTWNSWAKLVMRRKTNSSAVLRR